MTSKMINIIKNEITTVHERRYQVLYIISVDFSSTYLKMVVNALNNLDEILNNWLFVSSKIDDASIIKKVIAFYNKYTGYDINSYYFNYNVEFVRCMKSILKCIDYEF